MDPSSPAQPPGTSSLFYKPSAPDTMWDNSLRYHDGTYYLFHVRGTSWEHEDTGLATSPDGVHWTEYGRLTTRIGYGASVRVVDESGAVRFLCPIARSHADPHVLRIADSTDLIDWTILEDSRAAATDERWYRPEGRWGCHWPLPRPGGGFYAYGVAEPRGQVGIGVAESDDGISWTTRPPALIEGTTVVPDQGHESCVEPSVVYEWGGRYYALLGLKDLDVMSPVVDGVVTFNPGETTMIADSPFGPFRPAPRNRRVLVGNNAYFIGFADTPDGVLANHQVWEVDWDHDLIGVVLDQTYLAPLKRVVWDDDGTLRLRWWEGNDRAKATGIHVVVPPAESSTVPTMMDVDLDGEEVLILEGTFALPSTADAPRAGLYFEGDDADGGAALLVDHRGVLEYGAIGSDGSGFVAEGYVDREAEFGSDVRFRLIRKRRLTELYLDDHLMVSYCLPRLGSGRIGLIGPAQAVRDIAGWRTT